MKLNSLSLVMCVNVVRGVLRLTNRLSQACAAQQCSVDMKLSTRLIHVHGNGARWFLMQRITM